MKIAFTADIHFGMFPELSEYLPNGKTTRLEQVERVMKKFFALETDIFIIAGDFLQTKAERRRPHTVILNSIYETLQPKKEVTFSLTGNHDIFLESGTIRTPLQGVVSPHLVYEEPKLIDLNDNCRCILVPFHPSKQVMLEWIFLAKSWRFPNKINILVSHLTLKGYVPTPEFSFADKPDNLIDPKDLEGFDHVVLGDIHEPKGVYVGSPLQHSFNEIDQQKRFLIFDTNKNQFESIPITGFPTHHKTGNPGEAEELANAGNYVWLQSKTPPLKGRRNIRWDPPKKEQAKVSLSFQESESPWENLIKEYVKSNLENRKQEDVLSAGLRYFKKVNQ